MVETHLDVYSSISIVKLHLGDFDDDSDINNLNKLSKDSHMHDEASRVANIFGDYIYHVMF